MPISLAFKICGGRLYYPLREFERKPKRHDKISSLSTILRSQRAPGLVMINISATVVGHVVVYERNTSALAR